MTQQSEPVNEVVRPAEVPKQTLVKGPPTHIIWRDEGYELVHPEGYSPGTLEPLPADFHARGLVPDPATRSIKAPPAARPLTADEARTTQLNAMTNAELYAEVERMVTERLKTLAATPSPPPAGPPSQPPGNGK